jgi:hypothetical protein
VTKVIVLNSVLTTIIWRKMRTCPECPNGIPIAIVPIGRSRWKALTAPQIVRSYPLCAKRVEEVQKELAKIYGGKGVRAVGVQLFYIRHRMTGLRR